MMETQDADNPDDFQLTPPPAGPAIRIATAPLEPLYSMLADAPSTALEAMLKDLQNYTDEKQLEDMCESVGVSRRTLLEQVNLALYNRK